MTGFYEAIILDDNMLRHLSEALSGIRLMLTYLVYVCLTFMTFLSFFDGKSESTVALFHNCVSPTVLSPQNFPLLRVTRDAPTANVRRVYNVATGPKRWQQPPSCS